MNNIVLENDQQEKVVSCVFSSKLPSKLSSVIPSLQSKTLLRNRKMSFCKTSVLTLLSALMLVSVNAQAQWTKTALPATNVQAVAIDPTNKSNMLAGTACISAINIGGNLQCSAASGLYRSTDAGNRWIQVNDVNLKKGIKVIAYAPEQIASKSIFVSVDGQGVFRSTNGGVSWVAAHINPLGNPNVNLTRNISQIIVTNKIGTTQTVYALVNSSAEYLSAGGIYATINNGVSWQKIYTGDNILKLVVAPSAPRVLYISTILGEIRKATNVSASSSTINFTSVTSGLPLGAISDFMVDPINANTLYASAFGAGVEGFYRTTDGGNFWRSENNQYTFAKIAVDSKVTPAKFYGSDNASIGAAAPRIHVFSSSDRMTWAKSDFSHLGFNSQQMNVLVADSGVVFAGVDDGLYRNIESGIGGNTGGNTTTALNVKLTAQATFSTTVGGDINYTLTLQNTSTAADAGRFTVTSTTALPFGTTKISDSPFNSCTIDTRRRVSCSVARLNRGQTQIISLKVRLPSTVTGTSIAMSFTANVIGDTSTFDNTNITTNTTLGGGGANVTTPQATSNARSVFAGSVVGTYSFSATPVNSTDQLTYIIVSGGDGLVSSLGTASFSNPSLANRKESLSPSFTFRPKANVSGREIIRFKVRDSLGRESITGNYIFTVNLPGSNPTGNPNTQASSSSGGALSPLLLGLMALLVFVRRFKSSL